MPKFNLGDRVVAAQHSDGTIGEVVAISHNPNTWDEINCYLVKWATNPKAYEEAADDIVLYESRAHAPTEYEEMQALGEAHAILNPILIELSTGSNAPWQVIWNASLHINRRFNVLLGRAKEVVIEAEHTKDEDCSVSPLTDLCVVCGVGHGDPCRDCGGRGFHRDGCAYPRLYEVIAEVERQIPCEHCLRVDGSHNAFCPHLEHPDTDLHRAGCTSCMMAHDKAAPNAYKPSSMALVSRLNHREIATILHALRVIQTDSGCVVEEVASCDHFEDGTEMLSNDEIDALCERINLEF